MNVIDRNPGVREEVNIIARPEGEQSETDSNLDFTLLTGLKELQRFPVADGYIVMAEQRRGEIGFAAVGRKAWETQNLLLNRFSPLEAYQVLGGDFERAPKWLIREHTTRYLGNPSAQKPRPLPSLDEIVGISQLMFSFAQQLGNVSSLACFTDDEDTPCLDEFEYYYNTGSGSFRNDVTGNTRWADFGANGISGTGFWQNGDANLNLGPTSAGVAAVCFCNLPISSAPTITVQEYIGQGTWLDLWIDSPAFRGVAYGILFRGFAIRRIRLLVRDNEGNESRPFSWGGSF
ncbi:MAG: hypothetical protein AAFY26_09350 [Cyanobacteria bacterium J06638_22]